MFGPTIIERSERRETYPPGATESAPPGVRAEARAVAEPRPEGPAAFSIIARDALYGGATGVLVGGALLLITRDWDEWDKFLGISTGAGVLLGASVGVVEALARRDSVADAALRPPVRPELSPSEREAADARARTASLGWGRRF